MDTGKKLWKVRVNDCGPTFNVIAPGAAAAARSGLACAKEDDAFHHTPRSKMRVTEVRYQGTLDEPAPRARKAAR